MSIIEQITTRSIFHSDLEVTQVVVPIVVHFVFWLNYFFLNFFLKKVPIKEKRKNLNGVLFTLICFSVIL